MTSALIGNIGRFSLHDGPGIRTTIFFKGCPLSCIWCHNPELQRHCPELSYEKQLCIGCKDCASICPPGAIAIDGDLSFNSSLCSGCMDCVDICPAQAIKQVGSQYSLAELMEVILRDSNFHLASRGGVTLSGGEPTSQLDFILSLTGLLKEKGIHTAIETCGYFNWNKKTEKLFESLDLIYFDVKVADTREHKNHTGYGNERIVKNLRQLLATVGEKVTITIPLIPKYTASEKNLYQVAELLTDLGVNRVRLLPYHPFGKQKMCIPVQQSQQQELPDTSMEQAELTRCYKIFERYPFEIYS